MTNERNLQDIQTEFEKISQTIDGVVWEADPATGRFRHVSGQILETLGYTAEECLGDSDFWKKHIYPDDQQTIANICALVHQGQDSGRFEYRMYRADGSIAWIRDRVRVFSEHGRPVMLRGIMIDITETKQDLLDSQARQRQEYDEKRRYISEIEERNKLLQEIAWMQSHVIRAPLARLMSLVNLIRHYENSAHEQRELLDHVMTAAHALDDIIRDISSKTEKAGLRNLVSSQMKG